MMRLLISLTNWLLGFSDANIINSLLDDTVVDLLTGGGKKRYINMTSSFFSSLFSFGKIIGLTHKRDEN